jgi:hypothetical protein
LGTTLRMNRACRAICSDDVGMYLANVGWHVSCYHIFFSHLFLILILRDRSSILNELVAMLLVRV